MKTPYSRLIFWGAVCLFWLLVFNLCGLGNELFSIITFTFLVGYILMLLVMFILVQRKSRRKVE